MHSDTRSRARYAIPMAYANELKESEHEEEFALFAPKDLQERAVIKAGIAFKPADECAACEGAR